MRPLFKKPEPIHGVEIPPRRFTRWAALYFLLFFCLPVAIRWFVVTFEETVTPFVGPL